MERTTITISMSKDLKTKIIMEQAKRTLQDKKKPTLTQLIIEILDRALPPV